MRILEENHVTDNDSTTPRFAAIKGTCTAIGLYCLLYRYSQSGQVLVFDDCDGILQDELMLNIMKAALDSGKTRRIYWNADSNMLRREDVPDHFDFCGSVIFITNINLSSVKAGKMRDHLEAIFSRSHYIDLTLNDLRSKLLRIEQVSMGGMLDEYHFSDSDCAEIMSFVRVNAERMRDLSLRTVLKLADLKKINPARWQRIAAVTMLR